MTIPTTSIAKIRRSIAHLEAKAERARVIREMAVARLAEILDALEHHETAEQARRIAVTAAWETRRKLRSAKAMLDAKTGGHGLSMFPGVAKRLQKYSFSPSLLRRLYAAGSPVDPAALGSGIYVLFYRNELVYIGQSIHMLRRLREHRGEKLFDRVTLIPAAPYELDTLERMYLDIFMPRLNVDQRTVSLRKKRISCPDSSIANSSRHCKLAELSTST